MTRTQRLTEFGCKDKDSWSLLAKLRDSLAVSVQALTLIGEPVAVHMMQLFNDTNVAIHKAAIHFEGGDNHV